MHSPHIDKSYVDDVYFEIPFKNRVGLSICGHKTFFIIQFVWINMIFSCISKESYRKLKVTKSAGKQKITAFERAYFERKCAMYVIIILAQELLFKISFIEKPYSCYLSYFNCFTNTRRRCCSKTFIRRM